jgi:hypothetical protein
MDHQSIHPRRERVVFRKRIGEYVLTAYEWLDSESPAGQGSITDEIDSTSLTAGATSAAPSSSTRRKGD